MIDWRIRLSFDSKQLLYNSTHDNHYISVHILNILGKAHEPCLLFLQAT